MSEPDPIPRSPAEPMAFSRDESFRGAGWAWLTFMALLIGTVTVLALVNVVTSAQDPTESISASVGLLAMTLGYVVFIGGAVSFVVMLLCLPLATLIGRALRRQPRVGIHLGVYAALGASVGAAVIISFALVTASPSMFLTPVAPLLVAMTTLSVMVGWWKASRRARRAQKIVPPAEPRIPISLDRAFDDDATP